MIGDGPCGGRCATYEDGGQQVVVVVVIVVGPVGRPVARATRRRGEAQLHEALGPGAARVAVRQPDDQLLPGENETLFRGRAGVIGRLRVPGSCRGGGRAPCGRTST